MDFNYLSVVEELLKLGALDYKCSHHSKWTNTAKVKQKVWRQLAFSGDVVLSGQKL